MSEHPLITPDFIGTDEEKMAVLGYWSDLIGLIRSLNACVISHENKLAIIDQLQKEIALLGLEVNNVSAKPVADPDGSVELNQDTTTKPAAPEIVVNLGTPEVQAAASTPYESMSMQINKEVPVPEAMQRLAGIWYKRKK